MTLKAVGYQPMMHTCVLRLSGAPTHLPLPLPSPKDFAGYDIMKLKGCKQHGRV